MVIEAGAIPKLIRLSTSPYEDISEDAVAALANIAGGSPSLRDRVEDEAGIDVFVNLLNCTRTTPTGVQRRAVYGIYNYLAPWPSNSLSVLKETNLDEATSEESKESIATAIECLVRILDRGLKPSDVIETGVIPRLVQLLVDPSSNRTLQSRALKCTSNFLGGDDDDANAVIHAGLLPAILPLIEAKDQDLSRVALHNASKISNGSLSQIHAFLDCGLLKPVVRVLLDDFRSAPCQLDACWTVARLSKRASGDEKVRQAFTEGGGVAGLSAALLIPDQNTKEVAVWGFNKLLGGQVSEGSQGRGPLLAAIRSSEGPQNLRAIRYSRSSEYNKLREHCHTLLTRYFPEYSKRARV
ncbi:Importin alpha subunit (Karyopherin alpha subunit) (Serine-rich RNA polymerase I suppressor protein) [Tulasnella sp. 408]|nr:Importin alpha subunit (Karyopherin alpha subunit) (Serine-rich RNA polymerase I suppressor protein) [Tulasnella sp. 408]